MLKLSFKCLEFSLGDYLACFAVTSHLVLVRFYGLMFGLVNAG